MFDDVANAIPKRKGMMITRRLVNIAKQIFNKRATIRDIFLLLSVCPDKPNCDEY